MTDHPMGSAGVGSMVYGTAAELALVRGFVRSWADLLGLPDQKIDRLVLAVSELSTNTLVHTSGGGLVRIWADGPHVICEVVDAGPTRTFGAMPPPDSVGGRGLAIVDLVVDEVSTSYEPEGTVVRLRMIR